MDNKEEKIVIDFTKLDEVMTLSDMASQVRKLMNLVMTGTFYPATVRGTPTQIDRFTRALAAEKTLAQKDM